MSIEDFYWSFTFKQIVLVNSGKYCYVKVPLNEHICLLGANNGGKTSILNSMKFFLLPEENLHDCERKFGLKTRTVSMAATPPTSSISPSAALS